MCDLSPAAPLDPGKQKAGACTPAGYEPLPVLSPAIPKGTAEFAAPFACKTTRPAEWLRDDLANEMTVLRHGARQDREVNLTVVIDRHDAHHSTRSLVAGEEHRTGNYPGRIAGVSKG